MWYIQWIYADIINPPHYTLLYLYTLFRSLQTGLGFMVRDILTISKQSLDSTQAKQKLSSPKASTEDRNASNNQSIHLW